MPAEVVINQPAAQPIVCVHNTESGDYAIEPPVASYPRLYPFHKGFVARHDSHAKLFIRL